jgi:excisionase family DNA binding protein
MFDSTASPIDHSAERYSTSEDKPMPSRREPVNKDAEYFRIREASKYSRIGQNTLRKLESDGKIKFLRPTERIVLVEKAEIDRFLHGR